MGIIYKYQNLFNRVAIIFLDQMKILFGSQLKLWYDSKSILYHGKAGRAVYCTGLENRQGLDGPSWVRIPRLPPLQEAVIARGAQSGQYQRHEIGSVLN